MRIPTRMGRTGFTLLEVIIAIAIIGIMLGAVAPMAHRQLVAAREDATRRELDRLRGALLAYYADVGAFPPESVGLAALVGIAGPGGWQGPYYESGGDDPTRDVSTDAFGQPYVYDLSPSVTPAGAADLIVASSGANHAVELRVSGAWDLSRADDCDDLALLVSASPLNREKRLASVAELESMAEAARRYYQDHGSFPLALADLSGSYLDPGFDDDSFEDDWHKSYRSRVEAVGSDWRLLIWSTGPDRVNADGGGDDLQLEVNSSAIPTGGSTLSATEQELLDIQALVDADPGLDLSRPWTAIRTDLGLGGDYDLDEWGQAYLVNVGTRTVFSGGPDLDGWTAGDNLPAGVSY